MIIWVVKAGLKTSYRILKSIMLEFGLFDGDYLSMNMLFSRLGLGVMHNMFALDRAC